MADVTMTSSARDRAEAQAGLPAVAASTAQAGFSLIEALIAVALLLLLFGAAMPALNQSLMFNRQVGDLSEMHGSVRGATTEDGQPWGISRRTYRWSVPARVCCTRPSRCSPRQTPR